MKLLLITSCIIMATMFRLAHAQKNDTLVGHFNFATPALYGDPYGGYLAGHNSYKSKAKMQLFDAKYGVTSGGVITQLLFWFEKKGNPSSTITATIWSDNAGKPGNILGTVQVPFSSMNTSKAATDINMSAAYNTIAVFSTPVALPTDKKFWAGFSVIYLQGDSVGIYTSSDDTPRDIPGSTGDFPDSKTHTFEQLSNNAFQSFNDGTGNTWRMDIALAVFPVVQFGVTGINKNNTQRIILHQNEPNPSSGETVITYQLSKPAKNVSLEITDIIGRKIINMDEGSKNTGVHNITIDAAKLTGGIYFYTLKTEETVLTKRMIITE